MSLKVLEMHSLPGFLSSHFALKAYDLVMPSCGVRLDDDALTSDVFYVENPSRKNFLKIVRRSSI